MSKQVEQTSRMLEAIEQVMRATAKSETDSLMLLVAAESRYPDVPDKFLIKAAINLGAPDRN